MKALIFILLLLPFCGNAQTKTAQEAKIVVAVNKGDNTIDALFFLADVKKDQGLLEKYPDTKSFLGALTGPYEKQNHVVLPKAGATIKIFKDQEVFSKDRLFPNKGFEKEKEVVLGKTKATVLENKKGELILKTKNNED